jgi:hypothetical protein
MSSIGPPSSTIMAARTPAEGEPGGDTTTLPSSASSRSSTSKATWGTVELGETLEEALVREMQEETGLRVEPVEVLTVFDRIQRDGDRVVYHYVIVDYLCRWLEGEARAASDALEVAWAGLADLPAYDLPAKALEVVSDALRRGAGL